MSKHDNLVRNIFLSLLIFSLTACGTVELKKDELIAELGDSVEVVRTERGLVMIIDSVYFESDSARLLPGGLSRVEQIASVLKRHDTHQVLVEGHTDNVGDTAYNLDLSKKRSESVYSALIGFGVRSTRLSAFGYGESRPIADNNTQQGRKKNRRVQILILNNTNN